MIVHYKKNLNERYIIDFSKAIFIGNEPLFDKPRFDLYECSVSAELLCYALNEYYQNYHVDPEELSVLVDLSYYGNSQIIFSFGNGKPPVVYELTFTQTEMSTLFGLIPAA